MKKLLIILSCFITSCSSDKIKTFITCENISTFKKRTEIKWIISDSRNIMLRTLDDKRIVLSKGAVCLIEEIKE